MTHLPADAHRHLEGSTMGLAEPSDSPMPGRSKYYACPTHCCPVHGCKYGYDECPVVTGLAEPVYPNNNGCEACAETREARSRAPSYSARILNIQHGPGANRVNWLDYAEGHRDARHAAAEIALEAEAVIARLRAELAAVKDGCDIMGLAEEQRQKPGPFGGPGTPNAAFGA